MNGERDLQVLLRSMRPELHEGRYVFTTVPGAVPEGAAPVVTIAEPEGLTLVVRQEDADRTGLGYAYVAGWITLRVHSSLDAVGLTAAVAAELAAEGLSCNVVAGYFHDHLFVPYDAADEAIRLLTALAERAGT